MVSAPFSCTIKWQSTYFKKLYEVSHRVRNSEMKTLHQNRIAPKFGCPAIKFCQTFWGFVWFCTGTGSLTRVYSCEPEDDSQPFIHIGQAYLFIYFFYFFLSPVQTPVVEICSLATCNRWDKLAIDWAIRGEGSLLWGWRMKTHRPKLLIFFWLSISYRIMGYFRVAKFSRFCLKNMGIIFHGF